MLYIVISKKTENNIIFVTIIFRNNYKFQTHGRKALAKVIKLRKYKLNKRWL